MKAFGISQLLYVLQAYRILDVCAKGIERSIFGFLWIGFKSEKERGIVKREVMLLLVKCYDNKMVKLPG